MLYYGMAPLMSHLLCEKCKTNALHCTEICIFFSQTLTKLIGVPEKRLIGIPRVDVAKALTG